VHCVPELEHEVERAWMQGDLAREDDEELAELREEVLKPALVLAEAAEIHGDAGAVATRGRLVGEAAEGREACERRLHLPRGTPQDAGEEGARPSRACCLRGDEEPAPGGPEGVVQG